MVNHKTVEAIIKIAEGKTPTDGPLPSPIEKVLAQGILEVMSRVRR